MTRLFSMVFFLLGVILSTTLSAFDLPKSAVYPRIFSPNGDGLNDAVFFDVANPSLDTLVGKIYDREGAHVADLVPAPASLIPTPLRPDALMWDGRDGNGNTVRAGVYIYEVAGSGKKVTGTVVVAR